MQLFFFLKREILALQEIPSKKCSYPGESVQSFFCVCVCFFSAWSESQAVSV